MTGEAVALELRAAKLPSRALAILIDLVVAWVVYLAISIGLLSATGSLDDAAQAAVAVALFLFVLVGVPIAVETLSHGRSLGKLACGLRVVRDDGGPIRFRHALVRGAMGVVEILASFGVVACIASLVSARGRRIGDVFAGTLVVRERVPVAHLPFIPPPPPWLVGRFSGLDLSGVPDSLWLAVRQYLTRMTQLDPQVGWSLAERLAGDLAECTGVAVPSDVPPAAYLAAVVNERQARDARRAFGGSESGGTYPVAGFGVQGSGVQESGVQGFAVPEPAGSGGAESAGWSGPAAGAAAPAVGEPVRPSYRPAQEQRPDAGAGGGTGRSGFAPPA
ncbi:RDD family protein [Streptomyces sp. YIM 130001]|nr:RDD family protein [Streptomyces sp. YIM 130001]